MDFREHMHQDFDLTVVNFVVTARIHPGFLAIVPGAESDTLGTAEPTIGGVRRAIGRPDIQYLANYALAF
jgi:hypothetical protein